MGDTIDNMDFHGVGVFDGKLSPDDLKLAREIHRQLCEVVEAGIKSDVPPSPTRETLINEPIADDSAHTARDF
ncbi:hypothetical protein WL19_18315 [Burkholderia ubonensis]|nr:hypothetical protein WL19_18315 [Burkholderia ubonensis]